MNNMDVLHKINQKIKCWKSVTINNILYVIKLTKYYQQLHV